MDAEQSDAAVGQVYKAIAAVAGDMAKAGISKDRQNVQQHYKFRGIDDVYNALAPCLTKHGLIILPRCISRTQTERQAKSGSTLFYAIVEVEFDFVAVADGSKHTVKTFGEAMDSADKATNKAMSAAYKYAAFQAFCIPVAGENDADFTTHEVAARAADKKELSQGLGDTFDASASPPEPDTPPEPAPPQPAPAGPASVPRCHVCSGEMYDNRDERYQAQLGMSQAGHYIVKHGPKAGQESTHPPAAFTCKNADCRDGRYKTRIWSEREGHILAYIQNWTAEADGGDRAAKGLVVQLANYMGTIGIADTKQWRVKLTDAQRGQLLQKVRELAAQ